MLGGLIVSKLDGILHFQIIIRQMLKHARNILSIFYKHIDKNKLSILGLPKDIKLINKFLD